MALNCSVLPTVIDALVGASVTEITIAVTETLKVVTALFAPNEAVMFTLPGFAPVASPGLDCPVDCTDATVGSEDDQEVEAVTSLLDQSL